MPKKSPMTRGDASRMPNATDTKAGQETERTRPTDKHTETNNKKHPHKAPKR